MDDLETLAQRYGSRADFYVVYIREAHPTDGWTLESNQAAGILYAQPQTLSERHEVATACALGLRFTIPTLLDDMENTADRLFNAWPERLVVLHQGTLRYQGGKGPYGFNPAELDAFLSSDLATT